VFGKLFFLALAGIDDDSQSQGEIRVQPETLDRPSNVIVVNLEFVPREVPYSNAACVYHGTRDYHDFDIRVV
jgi:hypothetical protein